MLLGFLVALFVGDALAQRARLDDFLSPEQNYAVDLQWNAAEIKRALNAMLVGLTARSE